MNPILRKDGLNSSENNRYKYVYIDFASYGSVNEICIE
nr:MAG TPA: hypothetical protein [Caudoviricetes sp.]